MSYFQDAINGQQILSNCIESECYAKKTKMNDMIIQILLLRTCSTYRI